MADEYERVAGRSIRIPDDLWDEAKTVTKARGESISQVVRTALEKYVELHS
ncbi:MAG: hypothetical protein JWQ74_1079 [Marmoricola sp.]|nr:hypothetical protein [Marmoricola sp.]